MEVALLPWRMAWNFQARPILDIKENIQSACCAVCVSDIYSASVVERATVACRFALQDKGPLAMVKTYPDVDQHVLISPA